MSIFSRVFGKSPPADEAPAATVANVESPPPADPTALARAEEASLSEALAAGDMTAVGKWVLEASSTRTRQRAAHGIADPEQLRELIRATRHGNDKTVHRILTSRRDELLTGIRRAQQLQADLDATAAAIAQHGAAPFDTTYPATLEQLEARWLALAPQATPELHHAVTEHLRVARAVVEGHRQALEAESAQRRSAALAAAEARRQQELEAAAAASAAAEQARALAEARATELAQQAADEARVRDILGLLRQAQAALDHGGSARAARLRAELADRLPAAPPLPGRFQRQLEKIDARLTELQDWKTFRVAPRRAELLQQMQALVGAELAPEDLAQRIRRLRDEWRTLKRGAGEEPTPEWEQFQVAADRAYEPCREHFARQAEQRRENQARREALLGRLSAFVAEQVDEQPRDPATWRAINHAIVEARREWRECAPVDQAAVKPLQERFHVLLDELQGRLDAEFARNVQAKRALIARAAELPGLADIRQAIDESKRLQRTWKTVGMVPRNQDHALWEEFRRHCDAVFQRSSEESAAYAATLESNLARATGLCEEVESIAGLTGEPLLSGVKQLEELRNRFESLELPRASARQLQQRFSAASGRCRDALHRQRAAEVRRGRSDLLAAAAQVRAYALAVVLARAPAEREDLRASAVAAVAGLAQAPKGMRGMLERQLAAVDAGTVGSDLASNEATLRLLCVRAELAAGAATPPEDLELRREYQMRRLVESMGQGTRVAPAALDDLALEWLAVGPVEPAVHDLLLARFERCRNTGDQDPS